MARERKSHRRSPRLNPSEDLKSIYQFFIKPFERAYCSQWHEATFSETVDAFFNAQTRDLVFCKASMSFKMPGNTWRSEHQPYDLVPGVGKRHVKVGDPLIVRTDSTTPNRCEIEFDENIFVLTNAEFRVIREKLIEVL